MSKEIVVSSTRHETRLGVLEDDQLVELFIERESQEGLAGSIHKGRVTRVLPGMQSAFVDIGLERDAFLYVSDFVDSSSEFDDSEEEGGGSSDRRRSGRSRRKAKAEPEPESEPEPEKQEAQTEESDDSAHEGSRDRRGRRRRGRRGRRRGGRDGRDSRNGRDGKEGREAKDGRLPESKYAKLPDEGESTRRERGPRKESIEQKDEEPSFELLPGESLAKYGDAGPQESYASDDDDYRESDQDSEETRDVVEAEEAESRHESAYEEEERAAQASEDEDDDNGDEDEDDFDGEQDDDEDEDESDDNGDEDEDEDDGPNFAHDLEEAERIAALVEEQDEEDESSTGGNGNDEQDGDTDDESDDDDQPEADEQDDGEENERPTASQERESEDSAGEQQSDEETEDRAASASDSGQDAAEDDTDHHGMPGQPVDESADEAESRGRKGSEDGDASDDDESSVPGQPGSARVRGRSGSRNLQRRGRRGRRRGGRGARDNRQPVQEREPQERERRKPAREMTQISGTNTSEYKITDMLQKGNEILVQIAKEPLGKKGARITSHIALPGRYLVYMPTVDHVGVSRKIGSFDERKRLRHIVRTHRTGMPGGFIVRTAGDGIPEEEIRGDMLFLYNLWLDIRQKAEERENPGLVHQDLDIVERTLRDQLDEDFKAIWVDAEDEYERILRFVERFQPSLLSKVKLYTRSRPIFEEFNVQAALEKAMRPKVWLKSGGYIVINQTEALVSVDVNTGKYVGKSDRLEDTIVNTNVEAAKELIRQLRLRDLGGIIVVDFIDMDDRKNRQKVTQALEQALKTDRAPSKILPFNDFGLVAITRKRVKQSLERTLCDSCPTCNGSGSLKSVTTVIFEILEEAGKMSPDMEPQKDITLRCNPEVARALKSRKNSYLQELETILKSRIVVRSDGSLHRENFDIN